MMDSQEQLVMLRLIIYEPLKIKKYGYRIKKQKDRKIHIAFKLPVVQIQHKVQNAESDGQCCEKYLLI